MLAAYLRALFRGIRDLSLNPWAQVMTLASVTLSAFLGGMLLMALYNLDKQVLASKGDLAFQVYWESGADMERVEAQWREIEALPRLAEMRTFTPNQALEKLTRAMSGELPESGLAGADNPLPPTAVLVFEAPGAQADAFAKQTLSKLQAMPGVEEVGFNAVALETAKSWLTYTRRLAWPLIAFLALVAAAGVGNTIRLSLYSRRNEVEILRLVGAGRWYIRLPLLATGAVQALAGTALALGFLKLAQMGADRLLAGPPMFVSVEYPPPALLAVLAGAALAVALAASFLAARD